LVGFGGGDFFWSTIVVLFEYVNPAELELADLVDNNCNGVMDENFKYAFVTSSESFGNLGGLSGADQLCDDLAAAAALPEGDYAAWLSSSTDDARYRVTAVDPGDTSTYVNTDGAVIANDFAGLIGGTILEPIEFDESGNSTGGFVWTSTDAVGMKMTPDPVLSCNDWAGGGGAFYGSATSNSSSWSLMAGPSACDHNKRHYCIQR